MKNNPIIKAILNKIESKYPDDVAIFSCYGSFLTGETHSKSDIDFFFIPKTNRALELNFQFIIDDIGYDLWAVSWDRANRIADFDDPLIPLVADSKVLFSGSGEDKERFNGLRKKIKENLSNFPFMMKKSRQYLDKAKNRFYPLLSSRESSLFHSIALDMLKDIINSLVFLNSTYLKKGVYTIGEDIQDFTNVPDDFMKNVNDILESQDSDNIIENLIKLVDSMESLYKEIEGKENIAYHKHLQGFYEELKSIYNKLIHSCQAKDYIKAVYSAVTIDREVRGILKGEYENYNFPEMTAITKKKDYKAAIEACIVHEHELLKVLEDCEVEINQFGKVNDFLAGY